MSCRRGWDGADGEALPIFPHRMEVGVEKRMEFVMVTKQIGLTGPVRAGRGRHRRGAVESSGLEDFGIGTGVWHS